MQLTYIVPGNRDLSNAVVVERLTGLGHDVTITGQPPVLLTAHRAAAGSGAADPRLFLLDATDVDGAGPARAYSQGLRHLLPHAVVLLVVSRAVLPADTTIVLTQTECAALSLLFSRPDEVVSRSEFYTVVWDQRPLASRPLETLICRLRRKLGDQGRRIQTVHNVGYRLDTGTATSSSATDRRVAAA